MAGAPTGGNVYQAAAQGMTGAGLGTAAEMGYKPIAVTPGSLATTSLTPYQNPYIQDVINAQQADVMRGARMGINELGSQAQAAKAYGGSRHGVALGELGRGVAQTLGQQSAALRQAGFQQAQQAAQQDIATDLAAQQANQQAALYGQQARLAAANQLGNLSNVGFGMGRQVSQDMMLQGAMQQMLQQQIMDAAKGSYTGFQAAPMQGLQALLAALGGTPMGQTSTTTKQPGLFDYLTLAMG